MGSYMSFIRPGYYIVKNDFKDDSIIFKGFHKFIVIDLAMHFFMLIFVFSIYYNFYRPGKIILILNSLLFISIYLIYSQIILNIINKNYNYTIFPVSVYGISIYEFIITFAVATALYFSLYI
jgi:hypothetical protein